MRTALAIVLALGCGGGSKKDATMPAAPATCATVADAMVALVAEGRDNVKEESDTLSAMIRTRCDQDAWSTEAKECLAAVKTAADADRCGTMLTEEQQRNLVADQEAAQKKPEAAPAVEQPAPAAVMPPPPAPVEAPKEEGQMGKKDPPKKKASKPSRRAPPAPDRRQGDPCDGGE